MNYLLEGRRASFRQEMRNEVPGSVNEGHHLVRKEELMSSAVQLDDISITKKKNA
ncbi:hypothetical protein [Bacillus sp. AK031]